MQKLVPYITLTAITLFALAVINILFALSILNRKIEELSRRIDSVDSSILNIKTKLNDWEVYEIEE